MSNSNDQTLKNSDVSCLTSIFDLSNLKVKIHHAKHQFQLLDIVDDSYTIFYRNIDIN